MWGWVKPGLSDVLDTGKAWSLRGIWVGGLSSQCGGEAAARQKFVAGRYKGLKSFGILATSPSRRPPSVVWGLQEALPPPCRGVCDSVPRAASGPRERCVLVCALQLDTCHWAVLWGLPAFFMSLGALSTSLRS